jgi:peroxiredoxin
MQEGPRQVERAKQRHALRFEILMDTAGVFARRYGIYGLPQVMVIDKQGRLRYRDYGPPANMVPALKALLAEE